MKMSQELKKTNKIEYLVAFIYYAIFLTLTFYGAAIQIVRIVGEEAIYKYQKEIINYSFKRFLFLIILVLILITGNYIFMKTIKMFGLKATYIKSKIFLVILGIILSFAYFYNLIQVYNFNGY